MSAVLTALVLIAVAAVSILLLYVRGLSKTMDQPFMETLCDVVREIFS